MVVVSLSAGGVGLPVQAEWLNEHYTSSHGSHSGVGTWYVADARLHDRGREWTIRGGTIPTTDFRDLTRGGWKFPPLDGGWAVLTVAERDGFDEWYAWWVDRETAVMLDLEVVEDDADLLLPLDPEWRRVSPRSARRADVSALEDMAARRRMWRLPRDGADDIIDDPLTS